MSLSVDRWRGVLPAWVGICVAGIAAVVIEFIVLGDFQSVAVAATAIAAICAGWLATRRLLARNRQSLITVMDLRRR